MGGNGHGRGWLRIMANGGEWANFANGFEGIGAGKWIDLLRGNKGTNVRTAKRMRQEVSELALLRKAKL